MIKKNPQWHGDFSKEVYLPFWGILLSKTCVLYHNLYFCKTFSHILISLLLPYPLPDTDIVDDDIEKEEISSDSCEECDEKSINYPFFLSFCLVDSADSLWSEIVDKPDDETEQSESSEVPLIVTIESICEWRREWHTAESECDDDDRRETAKRCKCDTRCDYSDEFFHNSNEVKK